MIINKPKIFFYSGALILILLFSFVISDQSKAATINLSLPGNNIGLVGYWTFNGKDMPQGLVKDASNNGKNGSMVNMATSTAYTAGNIGQALNFDGVDDRVIVSSVSVSGSGSISAWAKKIGRDCTITGVKTLMGDDDSSRNGFEFRNNDCDILFINDAAGVSITVDFSTAGLAEADSWHHFVGVASPTGMEFYVDGISRGTDTDTTGLNFSSYSIGATSAGSQNFDGIIDEVGLYNRVLSATEVKQLYNKGVAKFNVPAVNTLTNGLVGYWTFDGKSMNWAANQVLDRSGNSNTGTLVNMSTTTSPVIGKLGQALFFDGSNNEISIADSASLTDLPNSDFAVSAWIKINGAGAPSSDYIISKSTGSGSVGWEARVDSSRRATLTMQRATTDMVLRSGVSTLPVYASAGWFHVVWSYVGGDTASASRIYVNGVEVSSYSSTDGSGAYQSDSGRAAKMGVNGFASRLQGSIDEVRVYDRYLSLREAKLLYNMGK